MRDSVTEQGLLEFCQVLSVASAIEGEGDATIVLAARVIGARQCSLLWVRDDTADPLQLKLAATAGALPDAAWIELASADDGVAGHVLATREPLWIADMACSRFRECARRGARGPFMAVPVEARGSCLGVLCASDPVGEAFDAADFARAQVIARVLATAEQVVRLERLLQSRVAQLSLARAQAEAPGPIFGGDLPASRVAKMLAKSFYRDLSSAGFEPPQIVEAASEIIGLISGSLARHRRRLGGERTP